MEQKRTLWILIASGVFLCAVVGTAFILAGPASAKSGKAVVVSNSADDGSSIWVSPNSTAKKTESEADKINGNIYDVGD